ncbi:hypothetical protein K2173_019244 [Erythroxylum novogranatense]|uniref:UV radiation resistance-associated gene protein n=1 Tax=Erythroxylum novogranatense TaxID=1862640 RepID=A0AAV8STW4_9ROSI|nr:hypothetical protein K2173_019244 [Erythroxylum novogranatense]
MEQDRSPSSDLGESSEPVKLIEWEDYEHEVARLWSLSSALKEAKDKKLTLEQKLQPLIQVQTESLSRLNELEEMRKKIEARKLIIENMSTHTKVLVEDAKREDEQLRSEVRSLLVAGTALSTASKQLQESRKLHAGERGYTRLKNLEKMLRKRQQYMISQVSLLYPVKITAGPSEEQELESFPNSGTSGNSTGSKPVNPGSLTILGLHLSMAPFTKKSFFTNKKEVQMSASALGYVAHAVSLIASYLQVPSRYPLRLGGSHSYVRDFAPSIETASSDLSASTSSMVNTKFVEFPLCLEGQDTTRAAYAVFLLNKDLEQLLNYIGAKSLGPRQILVNLKELIRTIQSTEFLDS